MYGITVEYARFEDISFADVLRGTGVYVIWDSQARAKPSYIGEGDILSRFSSHDGKFAFPVRGYIALIGNGGLKGENRNAKIVEALLLEVAQRTNRWPKHNKNSGNIKLLKRIAEKENQVRVTIKGCDPFGPPQAPRYLDPPKQIWFKQDRDGVDIVEHHWNRRKHIMQ